MLRLSAGALESWALGLLAGAGLEREAAATVAASLVEASLRGVDSHGVARLPVYSILLIVMNRGVLPHAIRLGGFRLAVLCFAVVWFGYFSTRVVIEYGGQLF